MLLNMMHLNFTEFILYKMLWALAFLWCWRIKNDLHLKMELLMCRCVDWTHGSLLKAHWTDWYVLGRTLQWHVANYSPWRWKYMCIPACRVLYALDPTFDPFGREHLSNRWWNINLPLYQRPSCLSFPERLRNPILMDGLFFVLFKCI